MLKMDQATNAAQVKSEKKDNASFTAWGQLSGVPPPMCKDADDAEEFLKKFRRAATANGWDEERQLALLPALFQGGTSWVADELEGKPPQTMKEAGETVMQLLCPKEKRKVLLHRLYEERLKPGDDPRRFVLHMQQLLRGGMPNLSKEAQDNLLLEQIPRVVPSKWTMKILDTDATSVEAVIRKLERLVTLEQLKKELDASAPEVVRCTRVCYRCGQTGHIQRFCTLSQPRSTGQAREQPGESSRRAPVRKEVQQPSQVRQGPLQSQVQQSGKPRVRCFQCGGVRHYKSVCPSMPEREVRRVGTGPPVEMKVVVRLGGHGGGEMTGMEGVMDTAVQSV